ncbi:MAG: hypothetical protein IVW51_16855 [Thermaceae bacterium]|nr:hypothetical protein [Thermaceae bacterium]
MTDPTPEQVVQRVRGGRLDCRTGILLLEVRQLGREKELAARLNLDAVDYAEWRLNKTAPEQRFLGLTKETLVQELDEICLLKTPANALLLYNFDVGLAYLPYLERPYVWNFLRDSFRKRPKALVVAMPAAAEHLLPSKAEVVIWRSGERVTGVI